MAYEANPKNSASLICIAMTDLMLEGHVHVIKGFVGSKIRQLTREPGVSSPE